jgi:hypothetical protein
MLGHGAHPLKVIRRAQDPDYHPEVGGDGGLQSDQGDAAPL